MNTPEKLGRSNREKKLFWLAFLCATVFYTTFQFYHRQIGYSDNAFLAQITESVAHRGVAYSQIAAANEQEFSGGFVTQIDTMCKMPLPPPDVREFNYFRWHTYFVLYLFAPLVWIFGAPLVLSFFTSLSFVGILGLAYWVIRKQQGPVPLAMLTAILIAIHPAWSSGLVGQIYIDRFFIGLGFLFAATLEFDSGSKHAIFIVGILCTLLSDRFGLAVGGITLAYLILSCFRLPPKSLRLAVFGLGAAVFSILLIKFYIEHPQYSSFLSFSSFSNIVSLNHYFERMNYFLIVNFALFGIFAIFAPRFLLIALALMIPNVIGSIGGAEKTGFITHYHSVYFPILAFSTVLGIANLYHWLKSTPWRWGLYPVMIALIILQAGLRYDASEARTVSDLREMEIGRRDWAIPFDRIKDYIKPGSHSEHLKKLRAVRELIPKGSSVSTPEFGISWLEGQADTYFYPHGLDVADYALVQFRIAPDHRLLFWGVVNYLGPDVVQAEDLCLTERIAKQYDVEGMKTVADLAILKRKTPASPTL